MKKISFCRKCSFPYSVKIDDNIEIRKYDGRYYGEGNNIQFNDIICPHIKEKAKEILETVSQINGSDDGLDIEYICYNWFMECNHPCDHAYWLSEIVLYLKGLTNKTQNNR